MQIYPIYMNLQKIITDLWVLTAAISLDSGYWVKGRGPLHTTPVVMRTTGHYSMGQITQEATLGLACTLMVWMIMWSLTPFLQTPMTSLRLLG